ncbi:Pectinesterase, catalytic [Corchorus capsularis]|uniref:Pectinesterase n=1 Tax=Corchorus capsularis TaxID=210143 RepID=A0A1R3J7E7_COCAP|nr:Pectinesterase, catalytic [Corchorus capsularis]
MKGKIVVSVLSIILVVGVAIGVVVVVHHHKLLKRGLSPQAKAVINFCTATDYLEACDKTLGTLNSTDPKEYIAHAILAAQDAVKKHFNLFESTAIVVNNNNNSRTKMALDDCRDMMDLAVQSLQASYSEVGDAQLHTMGDRINDLRTWLSAVISYQQSCLDGFDHDPTHKSSIQDEATFTDATQLTANALAIVTKLQEILSNLGLHLNNIPNASSPSRRLLLSSHHHHLYYPQWFSASDRKLLGRIDNGNLRPDAVVAKDGSGHFKTIAAALAAAPKNSPRRHTIYVKAGIYDEYITVDKKTTNILMYGDGPRKTIVTGHKNYVDGTSTWQSATFSAIGDGFIARSMGFQNTAGPQKHQAVALRVQSDKSAFFNCRMDGYQDTLYNQANRQFFRNCVISGTVDFIFGDGPTIIQNSLIIVRRPLDGQSCTVTAQGKTVANENSGTVIQNCRIVPEQKLFADRFNIKTYLGRPWKKFSTTVVMESMLADFIQAEGWLAWQGEYFQDTLYYAEYNNRGPGSNLDRRVNWKGYHKIDKTTAQRFTVQAFLNARDNWLPTLGIPYISGFKF